LTDDTDDEFIAADGNRDGRAGKRRADAAVVDDVTFSSAAACTVEPSYGVRRQGCGENEDEKSLIIAVFCAQTKNKTQIDRYVH
jgi:hypothetical protein